MSHSSEASRCLVRKTAMESTFGSVHKKATRHANDSGASSTEILRHG